jgi:hypothetical protein
MKVHEITIANEDGAEKRSNLATERPQNLILTYGKGEKECVAILQQVGVADLINRSLSMK